MHPEDDGVFVVDIETGAKRLLVSFRQMRDALVERHPHIETTPLFINHTLWSRDGERLFFFVRGNFNRRPQRVNVPMTVRADGTGLTEQSIFIGGHPEWELGANMIGTVPVSVLEGSSPGDDEEERLILYDSESQKIIQELGTAEAFPDPGNDVALSPDAKWLVQGFEVGREQWLRGLSALGWRLGTYSAVRSAPIQQRRPAHRRSAEMEPHGRPGAVFVADG